MKKIFENAVWWSGVVMVGLILGISLQFVRAWTEPAVAPPNGNVGAPINTGVLSQLKEGGLGINGLLKVFGALQIPTGAGAGKVLTSDAAGNAYWALPAASPPASDPGQLGGSCDNDDVPAWPATGCVGGVVTSCYPGWCPTGNTCSSKLWAETNNCN